jgi:hypothetical protein
MQLSRLALAFGNVIQASNKKAAIVCSAGTAIAVPYSLRCRRAVRDRPASFRCHCLLKLCLVVGAEIILAPTGPVAHQWSLCKLASFSNRASLVNSGWAFCGWRSMCVPGSGFSPRSAWSRRMMGCDGLGFQGFARGSEPQRSQRNARPTSPAGTSGRRERGRQCCYCAMAAVMRRRPSRDRRACRTSTSHRGPRRSCARARLRRA